MPFIRPYESAVSPMTGGIDVPRAQSGATARALTGFGQALGALGDRLHQRDLEQDDADSVAAVAQLKAEMAERRQQAALSGEAANPEWLDKEREYAEERLGKASETLRTESGRQRAQQRAVILVSEETQRLIATQATVAAGIQKNQLQQVEDLTLRAIQKDPTTRAGAVESFLEDLEGPAYSRLSKDVKEDYVRQFRFKAARAFLDGTEQAYGSSAALAAIDTVRDEMPAEQYTALRDHFTNREKLEQAKDRELEQYRLFRAIDDVITGGGDPRDMIEAGVGGKLLSAEQATSLHTKYDKYVEHQQKIANAAAAFRVGDSVSFAEVEPAVRKEVADAWVAEQLTDYAQADPIGKKVIANQIVKKGVDMDYVFTGIKNSLRTPPHGPGFEAAVDLYRSLENFDPYYASKYVSEDQRARFDVYASAVQGGATAEQALEFARAITPERVSKARQMLNSVEGKTLKDDLRARLTDRPFWFTGDMLNGQQAADAIIDRATVLLAGNPGADTETILDAAQKAYESRNVRMGQLWVPREFVSGVPADRMATVADSVLARLPDVLRKNNLPVVDGQYALAPDGASERDKRLQVYDPQGFPVPGLRFGPDDFKAEYRALQGIEYEKARTERGRRGSTAGPLDLGRGYNPGAAGARP